MFAYSSGIDVCLLISFDSLVGLAAALQARVLAQLKVKEESEERQRISEESSHSRVPHSETALSISATQSQHIKTESKSL